MSWIRPDTQRLDRAARTAAAVYPGLLSIDPGFAPVVPVYGQLVLMHLRASVPVAPHRAKYDDAQAPISHEYTCQGPYYFSFQGVALDPPCRYTKTSYSSKSGLRSHRLLYV